MKFTRRQGLLLTASSVGGLLLPSEAQAAKAAVAVIVADDSPLDSLPLYRLKRIFLGDETRAPNGRRLMPLNRGTNTSERIGFDRSVLRMSPDEVARYWIDRRIRGQSGAPRAIDPSRLLQRVVSRFPEAIGYAYSDELGPGVRALRIDGHLPGEPDYPVWSESGNARRTTFSL